MDYETAKCRRCGRTVKLREIKLDPGYRMMVCNACIQERKLRENVHKEVDEQRKQLKDSRLKGKEQPKDLEPKPAGWDHEDDIIDKEFKLKQKNVVKVQKVDEEKVKYKCPKCGYVFMYNTYRKSPSKCPYCFREISKISLY